MDTCPACGSNRVFRSRTRSVFERYRRQFTSKRPYRCHACGWRGWASESLLTAATGDVAGVSVSPPDLRAIDSALGGSSAEAEEKGPPPEDLAVAGRRKLESRHTKPSSGPRGPGKGRVL